MEASWPENKHPTIIPPFQHRRFFFPVDISLVDCVSLWFNPPNRNIGTFLFLNFSTRQISCVCRIHRLHICGGVRLPQWESCGPVNWGCRIHWLHLCRGARLPQRFSCSPVGLDYRIHRYPNDCPGYDTKPHDGEAFVLLELYGVGDTPRSTLGQRGSTW